MQKPGRNDACYCGSGKKYKKCCLEKDEKSEKAFNDLMAPNEFKPPIPSNSKDLSWIKEYDQTELLKVLAYLQALPKNHGKNLRIEIFITEVINKGRKIENASNLDALCARLQQHLTKHSFEDPPEEFATENLSFHDGNFIVYPGIFSNGVDFVQEHLFTLSNQAQAFPKDFVWSVSAGVMFILTIYHKVAKSLNQTYRIFDETETSALYIPDIEEVDIGKEQFMFSQEDIDTICTDLKIDPIVINQFTYKHEQTIRFDDMDNNPLFSKPFIKVDNSYLMVMPACEIACLNEFIINEAKSHNVLSRFIEANAYEVEADLDLLFRGMGWTSVTIEFPSATLTDPGLTLEQKLYRFDANKFAHVVTFNEIPLKHLKKVTDFTPRSEMVKSNISASLDFLKKKMPDMQIFLLTVINKSDTIAPFYLNMERFQQADAHLNTTLPEITVMTAKWHLDHLSLWKYVKALQESETDVSFTPYTTNLSKYDWFDKNHGSFYQSDDAQVNYIIMDFSIDGIIKREAKLKMDRITIPFYANGQPIYVRCRRKEQHYPVYFSDEIKMGFFRYALLKYDCPVWIQSNTRQNRIADIYQNALFYWLNTGFEFFSELIASFGSEPITISLDMDRDFEDFKNWYKPIETDGPPFKQTLRKEHRALELFVPVGIVPFLRGADNNGERLLIEAVLKGLNQLLSVLGKSVLSENQISTMLTKAMPTSRKKIIIISEATDDPALAPVGAAEPRTIQETDISKILHNQLELLPGKLKIPEKIGSIKEKTDLLNGLVGIHFKKLIELIHGFDGLQLLSFLMNRNEALISERAIREINIPVEEACYGQFYDVFERFKKTEGKLVSASLAVRSLIEFVACEMPSGKKIINDDDVDEMMAYMNELISYGSLSDLINFEINNPDMGLLPSGRLGIDHAFEGVTIEGFRTDVYKDDFARFGRTFEKNFIPKTKSKIELSDEANRYWDRVDGVFTKEWGNTLWNIVGACEFIANTMVADGVNVTMLSFDQLCEILGQGNTKTETENLIELLSFVKRDGVLNVPKKEQHETYPWRFNRRLAYISKPIIPIEKDGMVYYLISPRLLYLASQNLVARFLNGTLKVKTTDLVIQNLLAERNDIKGKQFRDDVAEWLKDNTNLEVLDHEAKIKPKGFFDADKDKGDVDILAIDHENRNIYSIECKNTTQAKIAYDIYSEIANYLGLKDKEGMIAKHVRRDQWLKENIEQVSRKLELTSNYSITSVVLTKNILPTKYIRETPIPMFAFADLKAGTTPIAINIIA